MVVIAGSIADATLASTGMSTTCSWCSRERQPEPHPDPKPMYFEVAPNENLSNLEENESNLGAPQPHGDEDGKLPSTLQ